MEVLAFGSGDRVGRYMSTSLCVYAFPFSLLLYCMYALHCVASHPFPSSFFYPSHGHALHRVAVIPFAWHGMAWHLDTTSSIHSLDAYHITSNHLSLLPFPPSPPPFPSQPSLHKRNIQLTLLHPKKLLSCFISILSFSASGNSSKNTLHSLTTFPTSSSGSPVSLR